MAIFETVAPAVDGGLIQLGDGIIRPRRLSISTGYTAPFWLETDSGLVLPVSALPFNQVVPCGKVGVLSTDPAAGFDLRENEPAGLDLFFKQHGNNKPTFPGNTAGNSGDEVGTVYGFPDPDPQLTVVSDGTVASPIGPECLNIEYPNGFGSGNAPVDFGGWDTVNYFSGKTHYRTIYYECFLRFVDDGSGVWENAPVGTKLWFFGVGASSEAEVFILLMNETGSGYQLESEWNLKVDNQNVVTNRTTSGKPLSLGPLHKIELYAELDSPAGTANGILKVWIDGALEIDVSNFKWRNGGDSNGFYLWKCNPTSGGPNGYTKTRRNDWRMHNVYISGEVL